MEAQLVLTCMSGPRDGHVLTFLAKGDPPEVTFGRLDKCTVRIDHDPDVSRIHARLSWLDKTWWLEDKKSTNGTFLSEFAQSRKITAPEALSIGQIFRVGSTRFRLESAGPENSGAATGRAETRI